MLQNYNKWRVLKVFFDNPLPEGGFQLREISRKVKIAPVSVKNYLKELEKEGLIKKSEHRTRKFPVYFANRDSEDFKFYKKIDIIYDIKNSGLLRFIQDKFMPDVIVLFGSAAKGEDIEGSDVDLFLQCREKKLDLNKFEKAINRKINLFFNENFNSLSKELRNNIINGIILYGYLKVF